MISTSYFILVLSVTIASISQIMLKHSANKENASLIEEYVNIEVIMGYILMLISTIMVIFALRYLEYKNAAILNSLGQVMVLFLSWRFLGESLARKKIIGIIMIIFGIYVFYL